MAEWTTWRLDGDGSARARARSSRPYKVTLGHSEGRRSAAGSPHVGDGARARPTRDELGDQRRVARWRDRTRRGGAGAGHCAWSDRGAGARRRSARRQRTGARRGAAAAARGRRLPVRAALRDGRTGRPPGLHPRGDRGPAHRGRRGVRDPARRARRPMPIWSASSNCSRTRSGCPSRFRPSTASSRSGTASPGRCSPRWPVPSTAASTRRSACRSTCRSAGPRQGTHERGPGAINEPPRDGTADEDRCPCSRWPPTPPRRSADAAGRDGTAASTGDRVGRRPRRDRQRAAEHRADGGRRRRRCRPPAPPPAPTVRTPATCSSNCRSCRGRQPDPQPRARRARRDAPAARRVPGPPLPQPRRAAGRPGAGRDDRPDQVGRPLRPRARRRVLDLRDADHRRRDQAALPRQGLGHPRPPPAAGTQALPDQGDQRALAVARAARRRSPSSPGTSA